MSAVVSNLGQCMSVTQAFLVSQNLALKQTANNLTGRLEGRVVLHVTIA